MIHQKEADMTAETDGQTSQAQVEKNLARYYIHLEQAKQQTAEARKQHSRMLKEAREHLDQSCEQLKPTGQWAEMTKAAWDKVRKAMDAKKAEQRRAKQARAEVAKRLEEAKADLQSAVTTGKGNEGGKAGTQVRFAYQALEEAEAGRKMELHECLDRERTLRQALASEMDNARQLALFGLEPLPEPVEEGEDAGSIRQLKAQAKELGIPKYGSMTKAELVHAIAHHGQQPEKETNDDHNHTSEAAPPPA